MAPGTTPLTLRSRAWVRATCEATVWIEGTARNLNIIAPVHPLNHPTEGGYSRLDSRPLEGESFDEYLGQQSYGNGAE